MKRALPIALLLACAHEPPATKVEVPPPAPVHAARETDPVERAWPLAAPDTLVRVDVRALHGSVLGAALLASLEGLVQRLPGERARCVEDLLAGASEVVAGAAKDGWVAIVRHDPARVASPRACFGTEVAVATPSSDVLIVGSAPVVARATTSGGQGAALAPVALGPHELARAYFPADASHRIVATLTTSDAALALRGSGDLSEASAHLIAQLGAAAPMQIESALRLVQPPIDDAAIARLSHAVTIDVRATHLDASLVLGEPPADQARDVASLVQSAIERYLVDAKKAEATNNLHLIARSLASWWEEEPPPGTRRKTKLAAFPAVPKTVPRGTTYASTAADWAAWAPLRFEVEGPQRYQYAVEAANDGKSANIVARGDLDGDGKISEFRIHVEIGRSGSLEVSSALLSINPDE